MPINQLQIQQSLRTKLLALSGVVSTPSTSLAVSGSTYVRTTGSFVSDLYFPGMEIVGSGFSNSDNDAVSTVKQVAALVLTVDRTLANESAGTGKSLSVDLPSRRAWENVEFTPDQGKPYIEENLIPGPTQQITVGPGGRIEADPIYIVKLFVPDNTGVEAANLYGDALVSLFASRTAMTLTNGDILRVRTNPGPFRGQMLQAKPGWAMIPVTIPLRIRTTNP